MKKISILLFLVAMGVQVYAQNNSSSITANAITSGWNTVWVEWSPSTFKVDVKDADNQSFTGLSAGFSRAFNIAPSNPVYVEAGIGIQYSFFKDEFQDERPNIVEDEYNYWTSRYYTAHRSLDMWSVKIPVSLLYKFDIPNSSVSIMPLVGFNLRFNISAKQKAPGEKDYVFREGLETDLFDSKDMGDSSATWNRFQLGWHIGVKAHFFNHIMAGVSYGNDLTEIAKKTNISAVTISMGYVF